MKVRFTLQLLCLMIAAYLTATQITKGPRHTGVKQGGSATLECEATIPAGDVLTWNIYVNDGSGDRVYQSAVGILPGNEGYGIIDGQNRYNLVINPATVDKAESFACRILVLGDIIEAELVVLDPTTCLSDTTVEIGDEMIFPCSVNFYGEITPRLALKLDGATFHSTVVAVGNTLSFQYNISADIGHDDTDFICEVFFDATGGTEPEYTDQCSRHVYVRHPPRDLEIYPDPYDYDERVIPRVLGENVTCTAEGRPEPDIWFSKGNTTDHNVEGGVMVIGPEHIGRHTYTCNAQNVAGNRFNVERKDFSIDVSIDPRYVLKIYPDPANYVDQVITLELEDHITCTAEGHPEPDIWFSKGNTTDRDVEGGVMVIGTEHIGRHTYQCHAYNRAGNIDNIESKEFTMDVRVDGSASGQSGLTSPGLSCVMAHVIVVVFSFLLHTFI